MKKPHTLLILLLALLLGWTQTCYARFTAYPKAEKPPHISGDAGVTALSVRAAGTELKDIEVHFIKVGQGDCILLKCPNGRTVLVDCGSHEKKYDPNEPCDYLVSIIPDKTINMLVITHPDGDHYNLIPYVLRDFQVNKVVLIGDPNTEYESKSNGPDGVFKDGNLKDWLQGLGSGLLTVVNSNHVSSPSTPSELFGQGSTKFYVLAAEVPGGTNARSIVFMVSYKNFDLILTGDATKKTEKKIMDDFPDYWLDCEVLKMGHHGSKTSSSYEWAKTVRPEVSVACATVKKKHGHPRKVIIDRLEVYADDVPAHWLRMWLNQSTYLDWPNYSKAVYSTATNGTIVVRSDGYAYDVVCDGGR